MVNGENRPALKRNQAEVLNNLENDSILGTKSIPSLYFRFALAGIMANLILGVFALIDGHFVGYFSVLEIEGIGIGFTVMVITRMVGLLFGVGAGAVISPSATAMTVTSPMFFVGNRGSL